MTALPRRDFLKGIGSDAGRVVNFHNRRDFALATGYKYLVTAEGGQIYGRLELEFFPKYQNTAAISVRFFVNPAGSRNLEYTPHNGHTNLALLPFDMAVDANRDGVIKFAGNYDSAEAQGKPYDKTEEAKPFRFWLNHDDDRDNEDHPGSSQKDSDDDEIQSMRDLEDFARLHLHIGGLQDAVANGTFDIGLEWRSVTGSPSIKVYAAAENDGGDQYLRTELVAGNQTLGAPGSALGTVSNGGSFKLPSSFWQADILSGKPVLSADNPNRHLIFEATSAGKGQLVVTIWRGSEKIGEEPGVWLDLEYIRSMYQRHDMTGENQWISVPFRAAHDETKQAIVFVHGWNMDPAGAESFAETMFKRLWWRGYKGRYAAVRRDTFHSSSWQWVPFVGGGIDAYLAKYNASEHIAWLNGQSLRSFVNSMPQDYSTNVVAHSMGNVVAGSAMEQGMQVENYALLQAAIPAAVYDSREEIKRTQTYSHSAGPLSFTMWDEETPDNDPDASTRALAYRSRLENVGGNLVSFYLPNDYAVAYAWEINNDQTKPPGGAFVTSFGYDRDGGPGERLYKYRLEPDPISGNDIIQVIDYYLSDKNEAQAFACRTWGKAVGAEGNTRGKLSGNGINLGTPAFGGSTGFDTEHSAEFNRNIQKTVPFYSELLRQLNIQQNP